VGIEVAGYSLSSYPGANSGGGYGYYAAGGYKFVNGGGQQAYGASFAAGDVIGVALNMDNNTVTFYKNNASQGAISLTAGATLFPALSAVTGAQVVTANFGATTLAYTPPAGFTSLDSLVISLTVSHTAPAPAFMVGDAGVIGTAPAPQGSILIPLKGVVGTAAAPTGVITGFTGEVLTISHSAPVPVASIHGGANPYNQIVGTAPAPTGVFTVVGGMAISIIGTAPAPTGSFDTLGISGTAPAPTGVIAVVTGSVGTILGSARSPVFIASLASGNVASVIGRAIAPIMEVAGFSSVTIALVGRAPVPYGSILLSSPVLTNYRTWVLNTRKGAITEYSDFAFNSFCLFNGVTLAAGSNGVVALGMQGDDAGTPIAARIQTGADSFGSSVLKRVPRIYVGHRATGDITFDTITAEGGTRTYALTNNGSTDIQQRRVGIGKGPKSRYWSFAVANVNGADFTIDDVLVRPTALRRRVQ
jgi:hypothetical protein